MGNTGPCGPCTEIHYYTGNEPETQSADGVNDLSEYREIWNLVFIQYNRDENGKLSELPEKHVDTGLGFERLVAILNGKSSNYDTDLFSPIIENIQDICRKDYNFKEGVPHRVIADHMRMLVFSLADGAMPGNEGRGYVLRRVLRRAARFGRMLEMKDPFMHQLTNSVCQVMGDAFPEIKENLFLKPPPIRRGVYVQAESSGFQNQDHTNEVFSEKWSAFCQSDSDESDPRKKRQYQWYLTLYGYTCEQDLENTLRKQRIILDAGCGLGYKAAWFARLAPDSLIVCMDFSDAIFSAAERYQDYPNIVFVKGDIANTGFRAGEIDMVNCDQVLHHTESPQQTLHEFSRITKASGLLHAYVYARKALPRELLDDHFRELSKKMTQLLLWKVINLA